MTLRESQGRGAVKLTRWVCWEMASCSMSAKEIEAIAEILRHQLSENGPGLWGVAKGGNPPQLRKKGLQWEKEVTNELAQHVLFQYVFHRQVHGCDMTTNCCPVTSLTAHSLTTV